MKLRFEQIPFIFVLFFSTPSLADYDSFLMGTYLDEPKRQYSSDITYPEDLQPGMVCITSYEILEVIEEKKPIHDSIVRVEITSADCKEVRGAATPWACSPSECRGSVGDITEVTLWEADPVGWILD